MLETIEDINQFQKKNTLDLYLEKFIDSGRKLFSFYQNNEFIKRIRQKMTNTKESKTKEGKIKQDNTNEGKTQQDKTLSPIIEISSVELFKDAQIKSKIHRRSISKQIEHWAKIGKIAEENPDLNYLFIQETLLGIEEMKSGETEPYTFN